MFATPRTDAVQDGRSLRKALAKWRDRFDENEDEGTRELLNFVFHACGATSTIIADSASLEKLDLSEAVEVVVKELAQTQGNYPIAPRTKGSKRFHRNYADFWEALVAECHESEVLFTSNVATKVIDWLTTLSRYGAVSDRLGWHASISPLCARWYTARRFARFATLQRSAFTH